MATYNDNSNSRFGDGLPLKSRRGPIGENWWAREWLAIIEADCAQPELEAGRRLARQGRVPELQLAAGELGSHVEESREIKFEVKMTFELLSPAQREAVLGELTMNTLHLAMLYAGKMPKDMNDVFDRAGRASCPGRNRRLVARVMKRRSAGTPPPSPVLWRNGLTRTRSSCSRSAG